MTLSKTFIVQKVECRMENQSQDITVTISNDTFTQDNLLIMICYVLSPSVGLSSNSTTIHSFDKRSTQISEEQIEILFWPSKNSFSTTIRNVGLLKQNKGKTKEMFFSSILTLTLYYVYKLLKCIRNTDQENDTSL